MPSTQWKEIIEPGEEARFEEQARVLAELARRRARGGQPRRALHNKAVGAFEARFEVSSDLSPEARVGIFAPGASFPAYVRFSNGSSAHAHDTKPDIRGLGVKLLDVPGPKILPGLEDAATQDFLGIHTPTTPFRDSREFVGFVRAMSRPALALPRLFRQFGWSKTFALIRTLRSTLGAPVTSLVNQSFYSALPIKFGPYAVRYRFAPRFDGEVNASDDPDRLLTGLAGALAEGPLVWDFQIQFFVDHETTPIEDASAEWSEDDAPFVSIARLVVPQQDATSPRVRELAQDIERLSFDPWHATEDFRPLGEMMRARKVAYRDSAIGRQAELDPRWPASERAEAP